MQLSVLQQKSQCSEAVTKPVLVILWLGFLTLTPEILPAMPPEFALALIFLLWEAVMASGLHRRFGKTHGEKLVQATPQAHQARRTAYRVANGKTLKFNRRLWSRSDGFTMSGTGRA
jgi:hypothetical protein